MTDTDFDFVLNDSFTKSCFERLRNHPKRIVFSEGEDLRILQVAEMMVKLEIGVPILLGNRDRIEQMASENGIHLNFVLVLEPSKASDLDLFCRRLERIEKYKGIDIENAREMISQPHRFAAMMVQYGQADGFIGGNQSKPTTVLRAVQQLIKPDPNVPDLYASTLLLAPHLEHFGRSGYLLFADTAINPQPDVQELAAIAVSSGVFAGRLFNVTPRIALLSHSTKGSNLTHAARNVAAATELAQHKAKQQRVDLNIDGELQADVALDPAAAEKKAPHMDQKGPVDVLVFPNLDSAHISSKILQHTSGVRAYGQFIMGLRRPAAQVPVTASAASILGTAAAVGTEAITANDLALAKSL